MRFLAGSEWDTLPVGERRRIVAKELARSTVAAVGILAGYFVLPMAGGAGLRTFAWILGGLVLVTGLLAWQVHGILRSPYPAATAVGGLMVSVPLFLVLFATTYYVMAAQDPGSWTEPLTKLDALYYTVTTFATVGFGDITAVSQAARGATLIQMVGGLLLVGVIARVVMGAVQESRNRRQRD
jgi:hypothetical protein